MKFIPDHEFKRGDAVLFTRRYFIRCIYLDREVKKTLTKDMIIYGKRASTLQGAEQWFLAEYPRYEPIEKREL